MTRGCKNHDGCGELDRQIGMLAGAIRSKMPFAHLAQCWTFQATDQSAVGYPVWESGIHGEVKACARSEAHFILCIE